MNERHLRIMVAMPEVSSPSESFQQMQRKVEIAELLARGDAEIETGISIPASDVMAEARTIARAARF